MAGGPAVASDGAGYRQFITDTRPWYKNKRIIALNLCICLLLITSSTNGYDGSMMSGYILSSFEVEYSSVTAWEDEFHTPHGGKNIGSLAAYPFAPYFADGFGRRPTIFFGACIMVAATILQTAAHSFGMFIGARFLIGFGLTFAAAAAPLLVTEIAYPTQRAQATSMYNTLWYLGSIIAAWTTFGTFRINNNWAWRIPSALQGLPSVLQIFLIWLVPESPRFLVSKGREAEALKTLAYYHANSNQNDPLVQYEFEEIKAAIAFDRDVAANVGWLSLFKSAGNRRRMRIIIAIAFFSQWSGNGLVSYYLNKVFISIGITDNSTQLLINGILNIWNFIIAIGAGFLCERVGRRRLFMTSTIGMLIFWTLQSVCLAFTPLIVSYTVEILPYSLRAKGFTIFNFSISLSLIFNQYVNPIALAHLGWKYYMVYVAWIAFEVVFCYFFIIETKGLSLEETAALFDGDETVNMITGTAHVGTTGEKDIDNDSNEKISDTRIE
ncbi:Lactose permease [Psilocybe cubensis]|uniref:Lactose permease n=1 Tax=Psilocybe cubensis TaxID=181762 RepID=A0ACB8HCD4_PSICU|nr:Lactose permease [Psilocybe cubensis]KAH9484820.1 Lactose permease [Psilocybe cubensis]